MTDQTAKMFLHGDLGKNYIVSGPGSRLEFYSHGWFKFHPDLSAKLKEIISQSKFLYESGSDCGGYGSMFEITLTQYEQVKQLIYEENNRKNNERAEEKKEMEAREESKEKADQGIDWIPIKAKFSGNCLACDVQVNIGDAVNWCKDIGVVHQKCEKKLIAIHIPQYMTGDFSENGCMGHDMLLKDAKKRFSEKTIMTLLENHKNENGEYVENENTLMSALVYAKQVRRYINDEDDEEISDDISDSENLMAKWGY